LKTRLARPASRALTRARRRQILHYQEGEHFQEHRDYFDPAEDPPENFEPGGARRAHIPPRAARIPVVRRALVPTALRAHPAPVR
jgi:hypothetical protein